MTTEQEPGELSGSGKASGHGKKPLERASDALLEAGYGEARARQYVAWMRDYVLFRGKRDPQEMGVPQVWAYLADGRFSGPAAAEHAEATAASRFLYEAVP